MYKLATTKQIENVMKLLDRYGLQIDDVSEELMGVILPIDEAEDLRVEMRDCTEPGTITYNDLTNDLDNIGYWKADGRQYVYIDEDVYYLNGKCCVVGLGDLKIFKKYVLETIEENS